MAGKIFLFKAESKGVVGVFIFGREDCDYQRRPEHRFGGEMMPNGSLSLEPSYIPVRIRRRVLARDEFKCVWCGREEKKRVSHFIQKRAGGETSFYNLVATCKECKRKRHYDTPSQFIAELLLEKTDVFQEMGMVRIKIITKKGDQIEALVEKRPDPNARGFYITYPGNGEQQFMPWHRVEDLRILGGKEKK